MLCSRGSIAGYCAFVCFICILVSHFHVQRVSANDFPSLLVANATMAIIIDHEYLKDKYDATLETMKQLVEKVIREDLKFGGLNIKYFSWSKINFNKDFTAVLSIADCKNSWETFMAARKEKLLLMAMTDADCPRFPIHEALMIPLIEMGEELPQIILDIRTSKAINWKTAIVVYDSIFDRDTISRVANAFSVHKSDTLAMSISLMKLNSSHDKYERKENVRKSLLGFPTRQVGKNYMVIATIPTTIIEVATELGMIDSTSQWLFLVANTQGFRSNTTTLMSFVKEGGNVAIATNSSITDGSCDKTNECIYYELLRNFAWALSKIVREEEAMYGQISDEEWEAIRLSKRERRDAMLEYIKKYLRESPICKACIRWKFESAETWGLRFADMVGNTLKEFKPKMTDAALWEPNNGLRVTDAIFPHIAYGFRNMRMPIAIFHNPPWQILTYSESGEVTGMTGISVHILEEMSKKLNFTYYVHHLEKSNNRTTYTYLDDFNVTNDDEIKPTLNIPADVLELLGNNQVLFGAAAVTVTEKYAAEVNFTFPISVQSHGMLIPRPKELSRLYLFTAPFTIDTWLCLSLTIALIGPLLYVINYMSPFNEYFRITKKGGLFKIGNCFWYIYGALLQQGGMYLPRSDSGRIIIGTWWLVVLVVVTTYCGNLVAFLTFPKMEIPVNTVHELTNNKNGYTWGIRANTYLEKYLMETDIEKYMRLNESVVIHDQASVDVVELVRKGKHVFIDWKSNLMHIMRMNYLEFERCDFSMSNEQFVDEKIALMLPASSPYLTIFNDEIYRLLQMGFIQKWLSAYLPKKDRCSNNGRVVEAENHTVNLRDMQGCFLVLIAGVMASIFLLLLECCFHKKTISSHKKLIKPFVK